MEKVTINGKEMNLAMNMAVAIEFNHLTGKQVFDATAFGNEQGGIDLEAFTNLGYAMLKANNRDTDFGSFDDFVLTLTDADEIDKFLAAAMNLWGKWNHLIGDDTKPEEGKEAKGKKSKNA